MTSVYIVGNCHIYTMQRSFKFFDSALLVDGCHVGELQQRYPDLPSFVSDAGRFDHVLSLSFGPGFLPGLDSNVLLAHVPKTVLYPTVTFGAFHPDVVYLFNRDATGNFSPSPLGPYHSALAYYGFRRGYQPQRTIGLFTAATYERLGYLSAWDTAIEELAATQEAKEFGLAPMALGWLRHGCFMHNPQHPKHGPICDIATAAFGKLGLRARNASPAAYLPDDLLVSHIWPVYPEIGSYYGMPGTYTFKRQSGASRWPEFMTLEEFVLASYECYALHDLAPFYCDRVDGWLAQGLEL